MLAVKLVAAIEPLMNDTAVRITMLKNFKRLETLLENGAPAGRVAQIILDETT